MATALAASSPARSDTDMLAGLARCLIEMGRLHRVAVLDPKRHGREGTCRYDICLPAGCLVADLTSAEALMFATLTGARVIRDQPAATADRGE